jgi:DNA-binding IclR family transcriptional regulator
MTTVRLPDRSTDRRFVHDAIGAASIDTDSGRLRQEFLSMPALCLTVAQTARLLNVPVVAATRLLADLERDGFLILKPGGRYRLADPMTS